MVELVGLLAPEMLGLAVTPAAIIGCLLLLGSSHPIRNVLLFAGTFLGVYSLLALVVIAIGHGAQASSDEPVARGWISFALGVLFLLGGSYSWVRGHRLRRDLTPPRVRSAIGAVDTTGAAAATATDDGAEPEPPAWISRLADPSARFVLTAGLLLSLLNPNIAILASGLGMILASGLPLHDQVWGVVLLLAAAIADFILPTIGYLVSGPRGRLRLRDLTRWLVRHNHTIGIVVLLAFGLLFAGRGLAQLLA